MGTALTWPPPLLGSLPRLEWTRSRCTQRSRVAATGTCRGQAEPRAVVVMAAGLRKAHGEGAPEQGLTGEEELARGGFLSPLALAACLVPPVAPYLVMSWTSSSGHRRGHHPAFPPPPLLSLKMGPPWWFVSIDWHLPRCLSHYGHLHLPRGGPARPSPAPRQYQESPVSSACTVLSTGRHLAQDSLRDNNKPPAPRSCTCCAPGSQHPAWPTANSIAIV